jgi:hypothetical protein
VSRFVIANGFCPFMFSIVSYLTPFA